eukprot:2929548-Prymnesium_polylepis.1
MTRRTSNVRHSPAGSVAAGWGMENQDYSHEAAHAASQAECAAHGALFEVAAAQWPACPPDVM